VLNGLSELWGPDVFPAAVVGIENRHVRKTAVAVMEELGPRAMAAVPALIDVLEDALSIMWIPPSQIPRTLEAITGQDFGKRPDLWRRWWEERQ
jgi:hypothetical protein